MGLGIKNLGNGVRDKKLGKWGKGQKTWEMGLGTKKEPVSRRALPKKHYLLNNTIKKKH